MRLTRAGEYAVHCILYLSAREAGVVISRREVAEAMEIRGVFLGKIAQQLARAGILEIVQGARGGFRLLRSPEEVTLLEVVEAVVGEIFLNNCLLKPRSCSRAESCAVHQVWIKARTQLSLRSPDPWALRARRHHGDHLCEEGGRGVQEDGQALGKTLPHKLRGERCLRVPAVSLFLLCTGDGFA